MSELKAQWGDPPKANMWKVREQHQGFYNDYVAVRSPILKDNGEFFAMLNKQSKEWEICYHDRFHRLVLASFRRNEAHSFLDVRDYFLSSVCWSRYVKPFLRDNRKFFADGFSTKVASPVLKAKRPKHQAMWGDPPKPNLWKVESSRYAGDGEQFSYCSVESPVFKEGSFFQLMFDTSSKLWEIRYVPRSASFSVHTFYNVKTFLEARKIFLSRKGWKIIKTFASIAGTDFFRTKVASSTKLQAMWGNPPKPNLWKVEEYEEFVEVSSPLLGDSTISLTSPAYNGTYHYQAEFNNSHTSKIIMVVYSYPYEKALKSFLSETFWNWNLRKWVSKQPFPVFTTTKVASSTKLQAMWGNPPKPNLWKVEDFGGDYTEVFSPLLGGGSIRLTTPAYNGSPHFQVEWLPRRRRRGSFSILYTIHSVGKMDYSKAKEIFLSTEGWKKIKEKDTEVGWMFTHKVASSVNEADK